MKQQSSGSGRDKFTLAPSTIDQHPLDHPHALAGRAGAVSGGGGGVLVV